MQPTVPPEIQPSLRAWLDLLERWNRIHALTALPPESRWEELVLDAAALLPGLTDLPEGSKVVDLGTGMGSPALILALARPDLHIIGLDAASKKVAFLRQSALELKIPNLEGVHGRFEAAPPLQADFGVAKALAPMADLAGWWSRHGKPKAPLLALKGPGWEREPPPPGWSITVTPYDLPHRGRRFVIRLSPA
ncbi:MAG: class I SAM-dependent methyltransferase [Acidobacteria bacterium]|nr:class I SAM-dependent methyltransferase [Acidobacteriota bacterium]